MTFFKLNKKTVIYEVLDGEVVILDLGEGLYYHLTGSSSEIWERILEGYSLKQVIEILSEKYISEEIEEQTKNLIEQLVAEKILLEDVTLDEPRLMEREKYMGPKLPFEAPKLEKFTDMQELLLLDPIHEVDEAGWPNVPANQ